MKERPVLMSAPMVRAILDGRKTQTRRMVKLNPLIEFERYDGGLFFSAQSRLGIAPRNWYGGVGDRLWCKETWYTDAPDDYRPTELSETRNTISYAADDGPDVVRCRKLRPSIFMRRRMSRITLELIDVRAERLNAISEDDAIAEGIYRNRHGVWHWLDDSAIGGVSAVDAYRLLWESINGEGAWQTNPFVWVLTFRRVE